MSFELNDNQKKVVEHKTGPLLVVAGAGTGKTRVIVERICRLLDEHVKAKQILAVTFTEKAAAEMLDRILESSGLLPEISVTTFNGYGDSILREFGTDIGLSRNFKVLGPQAQIVFFRERIEEFNLDYFLPLASSPDGIIEDILKLFSRLKQHVISPETYIDYAKNMSEEDEAQQLDKKKHVELSQAYKTYINLCRKENVIDYDDQIYLLIQLLQSRPNIQKKLQERYHTIFVDEFQDTNPMQSKLIDLLVNEQQNIVVVGDDDQSIYGFRGATIANILSFKKRYPKTKEAALTQNYRSHQSILDASYKLISHNNPNRLEAQLGIDKRLTSKAEGNEPTLMRFNKADEELQWLADDIASRIDQRSTDVPISIAVLTRSNPTAEAVHRALELAGVEHKVVGSSPDLYARPIVRMLIELTRTIAEPHNNASLHHTLVSELFKISNELIGPLASKARHEHESLESILKLENNAEVNKALELIQGLRAEAGNTSVGRLLWKAIELTEYKDLLLKKASEDDGAANSIGHLKQFFDSLREFESIAGQPTTAQYLISLPALMAAGESSDGTLEISEDQVTVTTVHKAKGLEWATVYVPYMTEQTFPIYPKNKGLQPPEELTLSSESPADEHYAEERRIMYVASTRARKNLIVSFSNNGKTGSSRRTSRFIDEMFGEGAAENTPITNVGETTYQLDEVVESEAKPQLPRSILNDSTVRLSVSQAEDLLNCPLNFYYKFVLHTPEAPKTSTDYGSQLHGLFEEINKGRLEGSLAPLPKLIEDLEQGWNKAGYSSKTQQERALARAKTTLTNFYNQALESSAPKLVEEKFEVKLPGDIILHGRIDVVFEDEGGTEIRDYKTGDSVKDEKKAKSRVTGSTQLTLYALAWQVEHGEIPAKVTLQFPDTNMFASVAKKAKSLETIQTKISKAAEDLRQGHFPPGPKHDYCIHPEV